MTLTHAQPETRIGGAMMEPGIHHDVPFDRYLQIRLPSQSTIKQGRLSMAHMRAAMDEPIEATDEMRLGSALHCAFLEPEKMLDKVVLWPSTRRGKEWEAFQQANSDRVILTSGYYEKMQRMVQAMRRNPEIRRWLGRIEDVEVTAIGEVFGVLCRGRCDALTDDPLDDIKKVAADTFQRGIQDERVFLWHARKYGYDIQGALYRRLFKRDRFRLIFVEDSPPHEVAVIELGPQILRSADHELRAILTQWKACVERNEYPGPFPDCVVVDDDREFSELCP